MFATRLAVHEPNSPLRVLNRGPRAIRRHFHLCRDDSVLIEDVDDLLPVREVEALRLLAEESSQGPRTTEEIL